MTKQSFVYIMTNYTNTTVYVGVTNNLRRRVYEHKNKTIEGSTKRYNLTKLVYYEVFDDVTMAIAREKQLKAGSRQKKNDLISEFNGKWEDLYDTIV